MSLTDVSILTVQGTKRETTLRTLLDLEDIDEIMGNDGKPEEKTTSSLL